MDAFDIFLKNFELENGYDQMDNQSNTRQIEPKVGTTLKSEGIKMGAFDKSMFSTTKPVIPTTTVDKDKLNQFRTSQITDGIAKGAQGVELAANVLADVTGANYDTSAEGQGVRGDLKGAKMGSKLLSGAAMGMQLAGPWGAAAGGILSLGAGMIGRRKAAQEYGRNLQKHNKKLSAEEKLKLDKQYQMEEGKAVLADAIAIRKKQLGYS
jgi:hypothetical protein